MDDVFKLIKASTSNKVPLHNLPTFPWQSHEDANDFLLKLGWCGATYGCTDDDYFKYMSLIMEKKLFNSLIANETAANFDTLKGKFLKTFGHSRVDYDLLGESGKMSTKEYH